MVIRRIREHVAAHNWFAVGIDFLIVVAGIVIGTQVNNWNQARIERNQGSDYRDRLIADLRANQADLLERQAYYTGMRKHAEATLAALQKPAISNDVAFLVAAYMASHTLRRQSKRFTYDELVSTGRFGQIGDPALREQVTDYYIALEAAGALFSFVPPYRDHIRALMPNGVQGAIRSQCPILTGLLEDCTIRLSPAVAANAVADVRSSPEVAPGLTRAIADLDVKLTLVESMIERERKVRAMIEEGQAEPR